MARTPMGKAREWLMDWWDGDEPSKPKPPICEAPTTKTVGREGLVKIDQDPTLIYGEDGLPDKDPGETDGQYIDRMFKMDPKPPGLDDYVMAVIRGTPTETPSKPPEDMTAVPPAPPATVPDAGDKAAGHTVSKEISDTLLNKIIYIESAGNPKAKAPTSSAYGLGQFINATWEAYRKKYKPSALRANPSDQVYLLARFTEDNAKGLKKYGIPYTPGNLYLAHFLGLIAAVNVYGYSREKPVSEAVSAAAIRANPSILLGKTCGEVRDWAEAKMQKARDGGWVQRYYKP
jgi:hypothetical protein